MKNKKGQGLTMQTIVIIILLLIALIVIVSFFLGTTSSMFGAVSDASGSSTGALQKEVQGATSESWTPNLLALVGILRGSFS